MMLYTDSYKMTNENDCTPVRDNRQTQYGYSWTQRLLKTQKLRSNLLPTQNDQQNLGYQSARHQPIYFYRDQDMSCSITQFTLDQSLNQSKKQPVHKRSMTESTNKNKFYCFSKIKEDKCRQQQIQSTRVIKSIKKINNDKSNMKQSKSLNPRKRMIQHLDQIATVQSKHSPRSSLNSLFSPQVQQSLIIMRGCDFINNNNDKNNNSNGLSKFFQSRRKSCHESIIINDNDDAFSYLFKGKGLVESRDFGNRHRGSVRQKSSFFYEDQQKTMIDNQKINTDRSKESKIETNDKKRDKDRMDYFLKQMMTNKQSLVNNQNNNSLSFLRVKKQYTNSPVVNIK